MGSTRIEWATHFPCGLPAWVWVGCTVEDQQSADERVPVLLEVATRGVRFLSCEPLLGPVTLSPDWLPRPCENCGPSGYVRRRSDGLLMLCPVCHGGSAPAIGWVIAGGESGRDARPTHPEWARRLRDQCVSAGVPFVWKQWGEWVPVTDPKVGDRWVSANGRDMGPWVEDDGDWYPGAAVMRRVVKHHAGRLLDGREWSEVPRG